MIEDKGFEPAENFILHPSAFILVLCGAPGTTRTCDPLIRSQVLYPAELRVHAEGEGSLRFQV
jgi:hypothetical protein